MRFAKRVLDDGSGANVVFSSNNLVLSYSRKYEKG